MPERGPFVAVCCVLLGALKSADIRVAVDRVEVQLICCDIVSLADGALCMPCRGRICLSAHEGDV